MHPHPYSKRLLCLLLLKLLFLPNSTGPHHPEQEPAHRGSDFLKTMQVNPVLPTCYLTTHLSQAPGRAVCRWYVPGSEGLMHSLAF